MNAGFTVGGLLDALAEAGISVALTMGSEDEDRHREISAVQIDSRLCDDGSLFVALPGERTDGHHFVTHAAGKGAICALVRKDRLGSILTADRAEAMPLLIGVDNTLTALQGLASWWLSRFEMTRVAITGSNGKTTTKEMIASILSREASTLAGRENFNSDVGLPLELLRARDEHRFGVFELGMNRRGEIRELATMVRPHLALITNIGTAHIGLLGSQDAIAQEKRQIFSEFTGSEVAIVPEDDPYRDRLTEGVNARVLTFGPATTPGFRSARTADDGTIELDFANGAVRLSFHGEHMTRNALAAVSVATELGVRWSSISDGLEAVRPSFGRGERLTGKVVLYQECYNANPESMSAALAAFAQSSEAGRRIIVLGGMRELGEHERHAHDQLLRSALSLAPAELWLIGHEWEKPIAAAGGAQQKTRIVELIEPDNEHLAAVVADRVRVGDLLLVKGSRGYELERIASALADSGLLDNRGGSHE